MTSRPIAALMAAAMTVAPAVTAMALPDLLDTPALIADRAVEATLYDLGETRTGLVAVGERGIILTRTGDSWAQSTVPVGVTLTAVAFNGAGTGLAVGHDGVILRSTDGGANWARVADGRTLFPQLVELATTRHAEAEAALKDATDETREDLEFELEDQLFKLETAQQSLEYGPSWPLLDVVFTDAETAWAVGAYNMIFRSTDGGATWTTMADNIDNFDDLHLNAILKTAAGSLIVAGEGGMLFRSTDAGESFERWDTDAALSLFGLVENGVVLVAYGFGDSYQISDDDGATWRSERLEDNLLLIGDIDLGAGRTGLLGGGGLMVDIGPDGPNPPSRPTAGRAFLSGGVVLPDGTMIFTGEDGLMTSNGQE